MIESEQEQRNLEEFIQIFPLVISTSFSVSEDKRKFKSEHIVSQLVMQVAKEMGIDGVAYLSNKIIDMYAYPTAINLAILIPSDINKDNNYWERVNEIKLTEPVKFLDFLKNQEDNQILQKESSHSLHG